MSAFAVRSHIVRSCFTLLLALFVAAALTACGGGDTQVAAAAPAAQKTCDNTLPPSDPAYDPDCGDVFVEITDADGDILSYSVDVASLSLTRADGVEVELLPNRSRIDFAEYVDLTELFTAARLPRGVYTAATLTLDYADAAVFVESAGASVQAEVHLPPGRTDGLASVTVRFDTDRPLVVAPGVPARLTLDFDLQASHTVVLNTTPPKVNLNAPVLTATLERDLDDRPQRVRGPLLGVDVLASTYTIALRPVHGQQGHFGRLTVHTTATTEFEVDGTPAVGSVGLALLAAKAQGTATVAFGRYDATLRGYVAARVYAGTSVPGGELDAVFGSVRARSGSTLTVHGGTLIRASGEASFAEAITVTLDPDTEVRKVGSASAVAATEVSVGSRIEVLGVATLDVATGAVAMSADAVRILPSELTGTVVAVAGGTLVADLQTLNRRRVALYAFAGTGVDAANDADAGDYEVALGLLSGANLDAGDPIGAQGFVRAFGSAPADFDAITLADYSSARAEIVVGWGVAGSLAPFSTHSADGLVVDLANPGLGERHHLIRGPVVTDLLALASSPRIVSADDPRGFALLRGGVVLSYATFAEFSAALSAEFGAGVPLHGLFVRGTYDEPQNRLVAHSAIAIFD